MKFLLRRECGDRIAVVAHSTRSDGDLSPSTVASDELADRRASAVPHQWRTLRQVHSDRVIQVANNDSVGANNNERPIGDALITSDPAIALAVHSGDCVPVGLVHTNGVVAAAHAGWKGLESGILEATVRQVRHCGGEGALVAAVGPHIRPGRYEFGETDLDRLVGRFGPSARSMTDDGRPALDLSAIIAGELDRLGVTVVMASTDCTAVQEADYWSHRARGEAGRIALVAWMERR